MIDKEELQKLNNKIQEEIDEILYCLQNEMETGNEETIYRQAKLFVFAKSIKNNLVNFFIYNENNQNIINSFIETFLYEDDIIEKIYTYLYENNGAKYDLFMDKVRLLDSIEFFLSHRQIN